MTQLLITLTDSAEIQAAKSVHADVLVLNAPLAKIQKISEEIKADPSYQPDIWALININAQIDYAALAKLNITALAVPLPLKEHLSALQPYIKNSLNIPVVLFLNIECPPDNALLPLIADMGIESIIFQKKKSDKHLFHIFPLVDIGRFISKAHQASIKVGISSGLEAPDIPRLLPYAPDWLGFLACSFGAGSAADKESISPIIRALLPLAKDVSLDDGDENLGTDRILVTNYILPMEIGAYKHEYGKKQKVRFNIAADVACLSANPEDMRHIFSYDLILDGIRNLVALGHVELVETLAERIAALILAYPNVQKVMVRVEKLELGPEAVGVEIERSKNTKYLA